MHHSSTARQKQTNQTCSDQPCFDGYASPYSQENESDLLLLHTHNGNNTRPTAANVWPDYSPAIMCAHMRDGQ